MLNLQLSRSETMGYINNENQNRCLNLCFESVFIVSLLFSYIIGHKPLYDLNMTEYYNNDEDILVNQNIIDNQFMKLALQEAMSARNRGEVPIGAIIVCNGQIVARGHNLTETLHDITAHAEMQAITAAAQYLGGKYLNNCTLYVTIEPCVMCAGALGWAQISRVVYGAADKKRGYSIFSPQALHPKTTVVGGILEVECMNLMKNFFKMKRNLRSAST